MRSRDVTVGGQVNHLATPVPSTTCNGMDPGTLDLVCTAVAGGRPPEEQKTTVERLAPHRTIVVARLYAGGMRHFHRGQAENVPPQKP